MRRFAAFCFLLVLAAAPALPQPAAKKLTTFKDMFGFDIGDDYQLATYTQLEAYWKKLASESNRMKLVEIGKTEEGRPHYMAIVSSPDNLKKLDQYKEISRKLALAEGLTDDDARKLAAEGKAVVWIDGGLHAPEVLGAQQLMQLVWDMNSQNDPETLRFLNDVILLAVHANPDGMEEVTGNYMKNPDPKKRYYVPTRLWQKYAGHDNNRDFYMSNQSETTNMNRVMYLEWYPQIMYNHHQTGPPGVILFAPPFRDPYNYNFDPLIPIGLNLVGAAMHDRFAEEGKPGATMLEGASFSTWFNGGLRTTSYFHNMIGLLTESNGSPVPMEIPFFFERQIMSKDLPYPTPPRKEFHMKEAIGYSQTANHAVLDIASRYREKFLFNIYQMGRNSIQKGSRDSWTMTPSKIDKIRAIYLKENPPKQNADAGDRLSAYRVEAVPLKYYDMLKTPEWRDPRGYILPSDQPDFNTATKFMQALMKLGVNVHRSTASFGVNGTTYPAGSFVVKTAQAFRPHVLDMFEPQDHPNDFLYPGGPPKAPYDNAGYTLAYTMGVQFDRILDGFDGPFEKLTAPPKIAAGEVKMTANPAGFLLSHQVNDAFIAVNRLLKNQQEVYWIKNPLTVDGASYTAGAMFVPAKSNTMPIVQKCAADLGLRFQAVGQRPKGEAFQLKPVRIALWDSTTGSMPSGWTRWLFEKFEFPFEVVYPQTFDQGNLRERFDVLLFVDGGIPARETQANPEAMFTLMSNWQKMPTKDTVPPELQYKLGSITVAKTVPELKKFVEAGGTIITIGSSTALARHLGLPVTNWLVERQPDGSERPLSREKYYVPGSILRAAVDNTNPLAYGMPDHVDMFMDNSPVMGVSPDGLVKGIKPVSWFDSSTPLRSGWAWGQHYLKGGAAVVEAPVGEGKLFLYGPEVTFRGQPHGTFKFLFNGIYYGTAQRTTL